MANEEVVEEVPDDNDEIAAAVVAAEEETKPEEKVEEAAPEEKEAATEEESPEEEAVKPAVEPEEEDLGLTAEQLKKLQETPEGVALYKSVQRGLTKKAQALSEERKANERAIATAKFLQENPDKALEILAEQRGRRIAPPEAEAKKDEAIDQIFTKWQDALGGEEQAKAFYPLLKETFSEFFQAQIAPIQEAQVRSAEEVRKQEYAAGIAQFGASVTERGEVWDDDVQAKMAEKMQFIQAADGASLQDYLATLHDSVAMDQARLTTKKAALARLRKAETKDEPTTTARSAPVGARTVTADMELQEALDLAVAQAEKEAQ